MADKLPSALLAAQAQITASYAKAETREKQHPIIRVGLQNQDFLMTDIKSIKESTKRAVKGYQRVKMTSTGATTRSHNFTGSQNDTAEVSLNWNPYTEKFAVYWDASSDNIFNSMVADIQYGFSESMRLIRQRMGADLISNLHSNRTQVANSTIRNGSFSAANDAFEITNSDKFFAYMESIMAQHDYNGRLDVMVDSVLGASAKHLANQGAGNSTNLQYQLGNKNIMEHVALGTDVAVSAYPDGAVAIALPEKSFAFIPWIPAKYRKGEGDMTSVNGKRFVQMDDSGLAIPYAVWAYTVKADGSSNGGTVDDMVTYFQVSTEVAIQEAYLSTANETAIYEFALVP